MVRSAHTRWEGGKRVGARGPVTPAVPITAPVPPFAKSWIRFCQCGMSFTSARDPSCRQGSRLYFHFNKSSSQDNIFSHLVKTVFSLHGIFRVLCRLLFFFPQKLAWRNPFAPLEGFSLSCHLFANALKAFWQHSCQITVKTSQAPILQYYKKLA